MEVLGIDPRTSGMLSGSFSLCTPELYPASSRGIWNNGHSKRGDASSLPPPQLGVYPLAGFTYRGAEKQARQPPTQVTPPPRHSRSARRQGAGVGRSGPLDRLLQFSAGQREDSKPREQGLSSPPAMRGRKENFQFHGNPF